MKHEYRVIAGFALAAMGLWLLDALIDVFVFHSAEGMAEGIFPVSAREVYMRVLIVTAMSGIGAVVAVASRRRRIEQEKLRHLNRVLNSIRVVEQSIRRGGDREPLVRQICQDLVAQGAYTTAWISLMAPGGGHQLTAEAGLGERFAGVRRRVECGNFTRCVQQALAQPDVLVLEGPDHNCTDCPLGNIYRGSGSLTIRLGGDGDAFGVLTASLPGQLVTEPQEQALFKEVASDIASALRTAEVDHAHQRASLELDLAKRREAELGFKIQQMLLFQRPPEDIRGADIAAITVPSQQVDGDFYDFFKHSDHCFDVIVADVMGKGTHAALLGAATKSQFLRAISYLASSSGLSHLPQPRDIVTYVHREMTRQLIELESFVTVAYARFDLSQGRLTFVDCGHTKLLHFRKETGGCDVLEGNNLFLGADEDEVYEQHTVRIAPGDTVLLYSDGILEAMDKSQEMFGMERLRELMRTSGELEAVKLIDKVMMEIIDFAGAEGPSDDLTCVAVNVRHLEASPPLARVELDLTSDPAELARVRGFVLGLSRRLPIVLVDEQDISRLELAVNEAASNIMRHAYQGKMDQKLRLEADIYANRLTIRLFHWGIPYDPNRRPSAAAGETRVGGFGLSIMAQCVDQVRYLPGGDGSHFVELTKMIAQA